MNKICIKFNNCMYIQGDYKFNLSYIVVSH